MSEMLTKAEYGREYSDEEFWRKLGRFAAKAGKSLIIHALTLYYTLQDKDTPKWAKSIIIGALGYFILPMDAIPDFIPAAGLTDDFAALTAALGMVSMHVKPEHKEKAQSAWRSWFRQTETHHEH
jgi:uncharacterized membrane protein YkvA (DUF1232 family)